MWVPVMVFAFLFGLLIDYEVFILARCRVCPKRPGCRDRAARSSATGSSRAAATCASAEVNAHTSWLIG